MAILKTCVATAKQKPDVSELLSNSLFENATDYSPPLVNSKASLTSVLEEMNRSRTIDCDISANRNKVSSASTYVLVMEDNKLVGIFTERDVVLLTAVQQDLSSLIISDVMTQELVTIRDTELYDSSAIQKILYQNQIHHLPILSEWDSVIGVITADGLQSSLEQMTLLQKFSVHEVMYTHITTAKPSVSVAEVAQLMAFQDVSSVVISQPVMVGHNRIEQPLGMITERDIFQFQMLGLDLKKLSAESVMSYPLLPLSPQDSLWQAYHSMIARYVSRLVVTDDRGHLIGILTLSNLLQMSNPPETYDSVENLNKRLCKLWQDNAYLLQQSNTKLRYKVQEDSKSLQNIQERFRSTFEQAAVAIAHISLDGHFLAVNQRFSDLIGDCNPQWLPPPFVDFLQLNEKVYFQDQVQGLLEGRFESFTRETHLIDHHSSLWVNMFVSLAYQSNGEPDYLIVVLEDIRERKLLETQLRSAERKMRIIFESIRDVVVVCTLQDGKISDVNVAPTRSENDPNNLVVIETVQAFWRNDPSRHWLSSTQKVLLTGQTLEVEYSLTIKDKLLWFLATVSRMTDDSVLWVARDISERKQAELELLAEKELAQVTLHSIGDAVITTDIRGNITNLNPVAEQMTGWTTAEVRGRDITETLILVNEKTRETVENPIKVAIRTKEIVMLPSHTLLVARDGMDYPIEDSAAPIRNRLGQVVGGIMVFRNATDSRDLCKKLSWQATHDPLTQLINRRHFDQILLDSWQAAHQNDHQHVLCFLDLDQFKIVNDTCGHAAGDELLCQVAQLFQANIRATDTLARLGGDEFAILLHQCPIERGLAIAENLCKEMQEFRFSWVNKIFSLGVSIGIVLINQDSPTVDNILSMADAACYAAKAKGRNRIQFYENNDAALLQHRGEQQWSVRIKEALELNRLCLYGQVIEPTTEMSPSHQVCEVLLRMIDHKGMVVTAGAFIPAAERFHLVSELDRWVISQFLQEYESLKQCNQTSDSPIQFMINLSGASIGDEQFLQFLKSQLLMHPEAAAQICFEVTETVAITSLEEAVRFMQQLKELGCKFALDDFGSGMSSFGYLKALPVDYLKIDGSFVLEIMEDAGTSAIVEAINNVGHIMGMKTIAEYVKDSGVRQKLNSLGVDYVQGFGIAKPKILQECFSLP